MIIMLLWIPGIRVGLGIADEGYLCYGAQQLVHGKVPIRDFRAYDPGRYLWVGLFMKIFGETFHVQRLAMSFVMVTTLSLSGWLIFQVSENWYVAGLTELLLYLWLQPYYKSFEALTCLLTIASGYLILSDPSKHTLLYAGLIHGLAYFIGLNLGLYASAALFLLCLICLITSPLDILTISSAFIAGTTIGLLPFLYFVLRHRGFAKAYWTEKVLTIFKRGTTNLSLPLPIGSKPAPQWDNHSRLKRIFFRLTINLLPLIHLCSIVIGFTQIDTAKDLSALLISAGIIGLASLHHLYSRCDIVHLCLSIQPAFLGLITVCILFFPTAGTLYVLVFLIICSIMVNNKNIKNTARRFSRKKSLTTLCLNNEFFLLPASRAEPLQQLGKIIGANSKEDDKCFFAPQMPGFYTLYNRAPAAYDTYCVYPANEEKQKRMIRELAGNKTALAIIYDTKLDGRESLRFSKTHPRVYSYLTESFERRKDLGLPSYIEVFQKITCEK